MKAQGAALKMIISSFVKMKIGHHTQDLSDLRLVIRFYLKTITIIPIQFRSTLDPYSRYSPHVIARHPLYARSRSPTRAPSIHSSTGSSQTHLTPGNHEQPHPPPIRVRIPRKPVKIVNQAEPRPIRHHEPALQPPVEHQRPLENQHPIENPRPAHSRVWRFG